jgi:hypothetical protein
MAFERPIHDIQQGDIWIDQRWTGEPREAQVAIVSAGNKYVVFMRHREPEPPMFAEHFRERFAPLIARARLRSQFSMSLANLDNCHVFFSPTLRKMFARSARVDPGEVFNSARGRPALPKDSLHIGTYADPVSPEAFFEDLHDELAAAGCIPGAR